MPDLGTTPPEGGNEAPATPAGQAENQGDAPSQTFQVPEKLKGKSAEELAKAYTELEKKLGEHSSEVAEARKKVEDALKLQADALQARKTLQEFTEKVYADPERVKIVQSWFDSQGQPAQSPANGHVSPSGNSQPLSQPAQADDTRLALQDDIFNEFYARHGIDKLPAKEKQEALQKISSEFADMFDPTASKTISQIVSERPLKSLRRDLERAFKLSDIGPNENMQDAIAQEQNNQAAIGSLQGATIREDAVKLTPAEEQTAKNLGITPEKYLKRKIEMLKERGSVS